MTQSITHLIDHNLKWFVSLRSINAELKVVHLWYRFVSECIAVYIIIVVLADVGELEVSDEVVY